VSVLQPDLALPVLLARKPMRLLAVLPVLAMQTLLVPQQLLQRRPMALLPV
jgi:hypothetical protein